MCIIRRTRHLALAIVAIPYAERPLYSAMKSTPAHRETGEVRMTPCACHKWMEVKVAFEKSPLFKFEGMVKRQGWLYCPFCGASLLGIEKPREEAEYEVNLNPTQTKQMATSWARSAQEVPLQERAVQGPDVIFYATFIDVDDTTDASVKKLFHAPTAYAARLAAERWIVVQGKLDYRLAVICVQAEQAYCHDLTYECWDGEHVTARNIGCATPDREIVRRHAETLLLESGQYRRVVSVTPSKPAQAHKHFNP